VSMTTFMNRKCKDAFLLGFKAPKEFIPAKDRPLPVWMKNTPLETKTKDHMGRYRLDISVIIDSDAIKSSTESVIHIMEVLRDDKTSTFNVLKLEVDDCESRIF